MNPATTTVRLGQGHCCACTVTCGHIGPITLCGQHHRPETGQYVFRATYAGRRVRVIQALEGAQWAVELDGVAVSVSSRSLSDFRSERVATAGAR